MLTSYANKLMRPAETKAAPGLTPCPRCGAPGAKVVRLAWGGFLLVSCPHPSCATFVWDPATRTRLERRPHDA